MVISQNYKLTKVQNATAAGTSDVNSDSVDMLGYENALFFTTFGTITASAVTSVHAETSSDDSNWNDIAGTNIAVADDDDNQIFYLEIARPLERYLRMVVDRGTQNAVIGEIYCLQGPARKGPVANTVTDAATGELHVTPAEGTI